MIREDYLENGFVLVKNLYSPEEMKNLIENIHQVFKNQFNLKNFDFQEKNILEDSELIRFFSEYKEDYINCMKLIQKLLFLNKLGVKDELIHTLKEIGLKNPVYSTIPLIFLNSEKTSSYYGNWKIPVHQDWRSIQGSLNSVVVWTPIVDCPIELGALEVIPKSHKQGLLPTEEDEWYEHVKDGHYDEDSFESVVMEKGDALIFSQFLIHRSGTNISDKIRYSFQFRFNDYSESTYVERGYPDPYPSSPPQHPLITPDFPSRNQIDQIFGKTEIELKIKS